MPDLLRPEHDGELLARMGTDATLWAHELAEISGVLDGAPGALLHGWLCNAIEAGRAAGRAESDPALASMARFVAEKENFVNEVTARNDRQAQLIREMRDEINLSLRSEIKTQHELDFLYAELAAMTRFTDEPGQVSVKGRARQLAARVNPEGRQYEGPESTA